MLSISCKTEILLLQQFQKSLVVHSIIWLCFQRTKLALYAHKAQDISIYLNTIRRFLTNFQHLRILFNSSCSFSFPRPRPRHRFFLTQNPQNSQNLPVLGSLVYAGAGIRRFCRRLRHDCHAGCSAHRSPLTVFISKVTMNLRDTNACKIKLPTIGYGQWWVMLYE